MNHPSPCEATSLSLREAALTHTLREGVPPTTGTAFPFLREAAPTERYANAQRLIKKTVTSSPMQRLRFVSVQFLQSPWRWQSDHFCV
ncbi:MAG: hypothetical protein V7K89_29995 [Nostoc sp.]|uniref:hypothetical protein n=1 Tax=Nostoc sp. TaxID=1180 RepID=UPI002FF56EEE